MKNSSGRQLKTMAAGRVFLCLAIALIGFVVLYTAVYRIKSYSEILRFFEDDGYYQGYFEKLLLADHDVDANISRYAKNLNRFYIYHRNFLNTPDSQLVTPMDMAEDVTLLQQNFYASQRRAVDAFNEAAYDENASPADISSAGQSLTAAMQKLAQNYRDELEIIRAAKLKEKKENYRDVENYLNSTKEFRYYIHDLTLNKTFTNIVGMDTDYYVENETLLTVDLSQIKETYNGVELNISFERGGIKGFIMIPKEQPAQSLIEPSVQRALARVADSGKEPRALIIKYSVLLVAAILGLLAVFLGLRQGGGESIGRLIYFFRLYLRIPLLLKAASAAWGVKIIISLGFPPMDILLQSMVSAFAYNITLAAGLLAAGLFAAFTMYLFMDLRRVKNEPEFLIAGKIWEDLRLVRLFSPFLVTFIWVFLFFVNGIILYFIINILMNNGLNPETILFSVTGTFLCAVLVVVMDIISCFSKLSYYIGVIEAGQAKEAPKQRGLFAGPVNKLNMLREGLYKSLDETLKLERSKTELITNVSHDLKTPLTSIINYVELLGGLGLSGDAKEYVEVLRAKAYRLKILIDDLFEAAKLSSHTMELNMEPVDVVQLFSQAIGELSEKIEDRRLDIRFNSGAEKIILDLDGKRMWRVFENLLNNIINYSPEGSRAYINMEDGGAWARITLKNISCLELDVDPSDLFERFKRGDSARATEGSGLGLSIAKNIIDLHGGKMDIVIDGDLFKTIITLYK